jgi:hypothetical protein
VSSEERGYHWAMRSSPAPSLTTRSLVLPLTLTIALATAACGDDTGGAASGGSGTGAGSSGGSGGSGGGQGGTSTGGDGGTGNGSGGTGATSTGGAGGTGGYDCASIVPTGECTDFDLNDPCECCAADRCEAVLTTCCETTGCYGVVRCAAETMCQGFDCYSPATCQSEIDAAGGLIGAGTNAAQDVGDCVTAQCTGCDGM